MNRATRVIQITDCHLAADPQQNYRGVNPHEALKTLLQKVELFAPDVLLATGDLSEDASRASYQALKRYFNALETPVLALPGNHDDADLVAEIFPGSPVDGVAVSEHGQWQIIRLNSCLAGKPEGRLKEQAMQQLNQVLLNEPHRPRLVALHHQPVSVESPWIDKYRLIEPENFLDMVTRAPGVKAVVWGHIHQEYATKMDQVAMLGGPSSVINSLPGAQKFTTDPVGPACRWLALAADGTVRTGILVV